MSRVTLVGLLLLVLCRYMCGVFEGMSINPFATRLIKK